MKTSWITTHKTGTNLWCPGIHAHSALRENCRIHEIVAKIFANPCLFALSMMTTQRPFLRAYPSLHHFLITSGYFLESKNALPSLAMSHGFPACLRGMSNVSSKKQPMICLFLCRSLRPAMRLSCFSLSAVVMPVIGFFLREFAMDPRISVLSETALHGLFQNFLLFRAVAHRSIQWCLP